MSEAPQVTEQKDDVAALSVREVKALWATAYDLIRPIGEIDSRAKSVLTVSLVLIGLSLSAARPNSISLLGVSFQLKRWIVLAIPLIVVDLYHLAQLVLAWKIVDHRTENAMPGTQDAIEDHLVTMLERKLNQANKMNEENLRMQLKRREIYEWYQAQRDDLARSSSESEEDVFYHFEERGLERDNLRKLYAEKLRESGIEDYDKGIDQILERFVNRIEDPDVAFAEKSLQNLKSVQRLAKARIWLDILTPFVVAGFAFYVFTLAAFFPDQMKLVGSFLSPQD